MPNSTPITINGYSLDSSASVMASRTTHENAAPNELSTVKISRRDGLKVTNSNYGAKEITIEGALLLNTQANFEQISDDFKRNVEVIGGLLDIPYWNGTRRYTVTTQDVAIARDSENIEWAPYSVKFLASDPPFGYDPQVTRAYSFSQITQSTYSNSVYFGGSADPKPQLIFDVKSGSYLTGLQLYTTSTQTRFQFSDSQFSTNDQYVLDTSNFNLTKNGIATLDYSGQFPLFIPNAWNGFALTFENSTGNGLEIDQLQTQQTLFTGGFSNTRYGAQTFTPSVTSNRYQVDLSLAWATYVSSNKNPSNITVEIRTTSGGQPTSTVLATAIIPPNTISANNPVVFSCVFISPTSLNAGTTYAYVIRTDDSEGGLFLGSVNNPNAYGGGNYYLSQNSGASWTATNIDIFFRDWMTQGNPAHNMAIAFDYQKRWI